MRIDPVILTGLAPQSDGRSMRSVRGLLNKQGPALTRISEITVQAHRGHMMRKIKADSLPAWSIWLRDVDLRPH